MRECAKRAVCLLIIAVLAVSAATVFAEGEITDAEMNNDITLARDADEGGDDAGKNDDADENPRDDREPDGDSAPENDNAPDGDSAPENGATPDNDSAPENDATPDGDNAPENDATPEPGGEPLPDGGATSPQDDPAAPENDPATPENGKTVPAEEGGVPLTQRLTVTVDKTTLTPGESARAKCQVYPEGASKNVKWATSDDGVAKITRDGVIRILPGAKIPEKGQYIDIWAKSCDGSLVMALETIYVLPHVKSVKLFMGDMTVYAGDDAPFISVYVDIQPASLFGRTSIVWQSSNPKIAMVAPGGKMGEAARIIWYEPGEVTITARAAANRECSDSIKLAVLPPKK